jgi:fibronectin type 3 domain-containing protein
MNSSILRIFIFCLAFTTAVGQTDKIPDLATAFFVKSSQVQLRWAPGKSTLFKEGNTNGYRIERILFDDFKSNTDNSTNEKAVLLNQTALKPWGQNDERWKTLITQNKNAILVYNLLYKPAPGSNKEMIYALALKSCDLYVDIAKAAGLYFEDNAISGNEIYIYRISFWEAPKTFKYTPALSTVNTKDKKELAKLKPIKVNFSNRKSIVTLITGNTEEDFSGFWIERSADSLNFTAVNKAPLIHATTKDDRNKTESIYRDSLPENNKKFFYRVRGISYFGELSEPSNIVGGKGKAVFIEYPFIDSTTLVKNKVVRLKFRMPDKFNLNELKGYMITRSETKKGFFASLTTSLLPKETTLFIDEKPKQNNYYKICAININNDSTFSFTSNARLIDDIPPAIPGGISGKIDTSGAVTLSWDANKEIDLMGYRVFRCNSEKEQPVEITKEILKEAKFTDKVNLQTLTREVYYTVRAVDKVYNNSDYSIPCKLLRPDKIAPVSPLFKQVVYTDSSILLNWLLSTSTDVAGYKLLKAGKENNWKVIKEWQAKDSLKNYSDTAISIGESYKYKLEVFDEAKNLSTEISPVVKFSPSFAPRIKTLKVVVNLEKRNITLTWQNTIPEVYSYTLYKAKGNEELRVFKTLNEKATSFIDTELYPNNKYHYTIKATLKTGIETKMSKRLTVEF